MIIRIGIELFAGNLTHEAVSKYNKKTKRLTGHFSWQGFDKCCRMFFLVVGLPSVIKESENHKKAQSVAQDGKCWLIHDEACLF